MLQHHNLSGQRNASFDLAYQAAKVVASYSSSTSTWSPKRSCNSSTGKLPGTTHTPSGSRCGSLMCGILLMLVANVADNLLQQIFDRHQACDAAVLIDDNAHVLLFALHLAQQLVAALRLRHKHRGLLNAGNGSRARFFIGDLQQVVRKRDAGDVVERSLENRHARISCAPSASSRKRSSVIDSGTAKTCGPRRHHFAHQLVAKLNSRAHQVAIAFFQNAFFFAGLEQRFNISRGLFFRGDRRLPPARRRRRRSG